MLLLKYEDIEDMARKAALGDAPLPGSITQRTMMRLFLDFGLQVAKRADQELEKQKRKEELQNPSLNQYY